MKILLMGIMGAGKTAVGKLLAEKMNAKFIELDDFIVKGSGYADIEAIFNERLSLWKELEAQACAELSSVPEDMVISCSGDLVENQVNFLYFREKEEKIMNFYLKADPQTLVTRLKGVSSYFHNEKDEILLEKIKQLLDKREYLYGELSDVVIKTDKLMIAEVVNEIEKALAK